MKKIIIAISLVFGMLVLSSCTGQDEIVKIILNSPEKIIYEEEGFNYNSEELTYFTVRSSGAVEENVFQGSVVDLEPEKTSGILSFGVAINSEFHTYEIYVRPKDSENLSDEIVMVSFQFSVENIVLNIGATPNTEGIKARVVRANASEPETLEGAETQELFIAQFKSGEPYEPLTDDGFFQNDTFNMVFKYENFQSEYEVYVAGGEKPITTEDAGFFDWILIIPVAFLTQFFASIFSNSFVVGILITTIIVRTLAWPIYAKSNDMSLKMNLAQPEIQRVQNKYATRKDPQSQQQMQAEMVQLYKKYGIGLGGCLMPFLQMPIFIAMFNVVRRITLEGGMYTNQVSNTYLFGIDLAANNEWYIAGVLSALVGVTMFVLQSLAQKKPSYAKKTGTQNLQAQQSQKTMKYVMYFMIFMMMSISYQSQALAVYWVFGNLYSITQTSINRKISEKKYRKMKEKEIYGGLVNAKKS